jgi:hypothetical protein
MLMKMAHDEVITRIKHSNNLSCYNAAAFLTLQCAVVHLIISGLSHDSECQDPATNNALPSLAARRNLFHSLGTLKIRKMNELIYDPSELFSLQ